MLVDHRAFRRSHVSAGHTTAASPNEYLVCRSGHPQRYLAGWVTFGSTGPTRIPPRARPKHLPRPTRPNTSALPRRPRRPTRSARTRPQRHHPLEHPLPRRRTHRTSCELAANPADVIRLSPLGSEHINMLGRYTFNPTPNNQPLRPLRQPQTHPPTPTPVP